MSISTNDDDFTIEIGRCLLKKEDSVSIILLSNKKSFSITYPESCILKKMMSKPGEVIKKDDLIIEAWGRTDIIGPNSLPVAITNLRKILEIENIKIINSPRKGYKVVIPIKEEIPPIIDNKKDVKLRGNIKEEYTKIKNKKYHEKSRIKNKLYLIISITSIIIILHITLYILFSWVKVECTNTLDSTICYVSGDSVNLQSFKDTSGEFYYSSNNGIIKVNNK